MAPFDVAAVRAQFPALKKSEWVRRPEAARVPPRRRQAVLNYMTPHSMRCPAAGVHGQCRRLADARHRRRPRQRVPADGQRANRTRCPPGTQVSAPRADANRTVHVYR